MRKPSHTKKFYPDAGLLWYAAALAGLSLFCFVSVPSSFVCAEENSAGAGTESVCSVQSTTVPSDKADPGTDAPSVSAYEDAVPVFLMQGDCGAEVFRLQTQLESLGYDVGEHKGVYTGQTASAVRRFQLDSGFVGDGICSAAVSQALAYLDGMTVTETDIPQETVCRALEDAGCWAHVSDAAEEPLPHQVRMRNALILFQRTHGLCGTGNADYATLCALGILDGRRLAAAGAGAEAAQFDLRCRLLTEALADYVLRYPGAYDLYTLTVYAAMLCNRVEDSRFPGSFDAVCAAGADRIGDVESTVPHRDAVEQRARDMLLIRAAEDALYAYLYAGEACGDQARGAVYVCPADGTLPQDAEICICVRDFVFFR